jgi:hypothetical protein
LGGGGGGTENNRQDYRVSRTGRVINENATLTTSSLSFSPLITRAVRKISAYEVISFYC